MLTLPEAAVLVELRNGPKTVSELSIGTGDLATGIGLTVMHLEQAKLVIGFGLPRKYGMSDAGELALKDWRRVVGRLVEKAWQD